MKNEKLRSKLFTIWEEQRDSREFEYISINTSKESVMILPILPDGRIILIQKYCIASDSFEKVLPGGTIEEGESEEETVMRELHEETGYTSKELIKGGTLQILPGYLVGKTQWFIAKDTSDNNQGISDTGEVEKIVIYSVEETKNMIKKGEITDSRTIAIFLSYLTFYHEKML